MIDFHFFWSEILLFWSDIDSFWSTVTPFWSDFHSFSSEWRITRFVYSFTLREYFQKKILGNLYVLLGEVHHETLVSRLHTVISSPLYIDEIRNTRYLYIIIFICSKFLNFSRKIHQFTRLPPRLTKGRGDGYHPTRGFFPVTPKPKRK